MARVDFYILRESGSTTRQIFACRLAEKAYRLDNRVHIHTGTKADADRLDELLWTFRDGSFVPHGLLGDAADEAPPVTIGCESANVQPCDLLINLCDEIPVFADTFPRIAELVSADEDCKLEGRRRFTSYRDRGHTIETHTV